MEIFDIQKNKHISQDAPGAYQFRNDCGAACVAMIEWSLLGKHRTPDEIYASLSNTDRYLAVWELDKALKEAGIESYWKYNSSIVDLFETLLKGVSVIVLFNYGTFQDWAKENDIDLKTSFRGAHFAVISGMDTKNIILYDPLSPIKTFLITHESWMEMWDDAKLQNNNAKGMLIPKKPIVLPEPPQEELEILNRIRVTTNRLNVRTEPRISWETFARQTLSRGTVKPVFEIKKISSKEVWVRINDIHWVALRYNAQDLGVLLESN